MHQRTPDSGRIVLHGWDSRSQEWHGPDELSYTLTGCRRVLNKLRELQGSWHGPVRVPMPGGLTLTFNVQVYDLGDVGLSLIDMDGSPGGPLEVVLVIPARRRKLAREELAFEFAAFLRFLEGRTSRGSELLIHDRVERVLKDASPDTTIVLSVETNFAPEVRLLVSEQAEKLAMCMIAWLEEKDAEHRARARKKA